MRFKSYQKLIVSVIVAVFLFLNPWKAIAQGFQQTDLTIDFYYSLTCPYCMKEKPLLRYIEENNSNIAVNFVDVDQQAELWDKYNKEHEIPAAIPRTIIGDYSFIGYSEVDGELEYSPVYKANIGYRNQILNAIETTVGQEINLPEEVSQTQQHKLPWLVFLTPFLYLSSYPIFRKSLQTEGRKRYWIGGLLATTVISLFAFIALTPDVLIKTFAQTFPFPLFVFFIALADGFNPCAFTVLIILLSLLTYTKSRKDMSWIGGTFILTSAVMYFIFIMGMVLVGSIFLQNYGHLFLLILGSVITIAGLINIKDYFFYNKLVSLSLSKEQKLTITKKSSKIVNRLRETQNNPKMFIAALGGTVLLAAFVNLVELGCTAILPAVYMTSLVQYCTTNTWLCYSTWTGFYSLVYILPLFAILFNFIYSFKSSRLSESQGQNLKLVAGLFMLFFGLMMIFQPGLLTLS